MIRRIALPVEGFASLRQDAFAEEVGFVETTVTEWEDGRHRFDRPGEGLYGYFDGPQFVAIGGLTADPHVSRADVGRLRRLYVRPALRGRGLGTAMVQHLLAAAAEGSFAEVRLRAANDRAARLYERLGFRRIKDPQATHVLPLGDDGPTATECGADAVC